MIPHFLHIYDKPKLGTAYQSRVPVTNYRHKISAIGGFDTASCNIMPPPGDIEKWLDNHLGNRVAVFVDNPMEPIWEGFINRMTFSAGGYQYTISLDEMVNRASTIYTASGAPSESAAVNNLDSQAVYGIKAGKIEMGPQGSVATARTVLRDTVLAQRAWPKASITQGGGNGTVTVEMLGFWHTLAWETWTDSTSAVAQANTLITTILLPGMANGATFFNNADFADIASNTVTILRTRNRGQTMQEILTEIAETGDGTNIYVIGITPTDIQTGTRRLYYRAFNSTIEYTARRGDGLRIRNLWGKLERPWTVRPDKGIRITDLLPFWNGLGDNPCETWIASIDYDANQQAVTWTGTDDITVEGAFQLHQYNKAHGRRFGAPRRFV